jgi:hypothetical protein
MVSLCLQSDAAGAQRRRVPIYRAFGRWSNGRRLILGAKMTCTERESVDNDMHYRPVGQLIYDPLRLSPKSPKQAGAKDFVIAEAPANCRTGVPLRDR